MLDYISPAFSFSEIDDSQIQYPDDILEFKVLDSFWQCKERFVAIYKTPTVIKGFCVDHITYGLFGVDDVSNVIVNGISFLAMPTDLTAIKPLKIALDDDHVSDWYKQNVACDLDIEF